MKPLNFILILIICIGLINALGVNIPVAPTTTSSGGGFTTDQNDELNTTGTPNFTGMYLFDDLELRTSDTDILEDDEVGRQILFTAPQYEEIGARIWADAPADWVSAGSWRLPTDLHFGVQGESGSDETLTPALTLSKSSGMVMPSGFTSNGNADINGLVDISSNLDVHGQSKHYDNKKARFGDGNDATIEYDSVTGNLKINPRNVGSGNLSVPSNIVITGCIVYNGGTLGTCV